MIAITAIIPAYNEEARLPATIKAVRELSGIQQIVVVDDGSTDLTSEAACRVLEGFGVKSAPGSIGRDSEPRSIVLSHPRNLGKGAAIATALSRVESPYVLLVDADLGDSAEGLSPLINHLAAQEALDAATAMLIAVPSFSGQRGGGLGNVVRYAREQTAGRTGLTLRAPLSGQRLIETDLLRGLEIAPGFALEVGLTLGAWQAGAKIVEVPVQITHRRTGKDLAGFVHRARQFWDIWRYFRGCEQRISGQRASPDASEPAAP